MLAERNVPFVAHSGVRETRNVEGNVAENATALGISLGRLLGTNIAGNITRSEAAILTGRSAGNVAGKARVIKTGKEIRTRCTATAVTGKGASGLRGRRNGKVGSGYERSVVQSLARGRQKECESSKEFSNGQGGAER
jgi:hypothetical protein